LSIDRFFYLFAHNSSVDEEKDLGASINQSLKNNSQCIAAEKAANRTFV